MVNSEFRGAQVNFQLQAQKTEKYTLKKFLIFFSKKKKKKKNKNKLLKNLLYFFQKKKKKKKAALKNFLYFFPKNLLWKNVLHFSGKKMFLIFQVDCWSSRKGQFPAPSLKTKISLIFPKKNVPYILVWLLIKLKGIIFNTRPRKIKKKFPWKDFLYYC